MSEQEDGSQLTARELVWQHASEAGLQDAIKRVAAAFALPGQPAITNIEITTPGKQTYLVEPFPEYQRIRPFENDRYIDVATGRIKRKQT